MKCGFLWDEIPWFSPKSPSSQADSRISFLSFWDRFLARAVRKKPGKSAGNGDFMVAKNPGHDEFMVVSQTKIVILWWYQNQLWLKQ